MRILYNGKTIGKMDQRFSKSVWLDGNYKDPRIRRHRKPFRLKSLAKRIIILALVLGFVGLHTYKKPEIRPEIPKTPENAPENATEPPSSQSDQSVAEGDIFAVYWGDLAGEARKVCACESGGDPNAISKTGDYGLMQINFKTWSKVFNVTKEQLLDPDTNLRIAREIYLRTNSWTAWKSSKNCHSLID